MVGGGAAGRPGKADTRLPDEFAAVQFTQLVNLVTQLKHSKIISTPTSSLVLRPAGGGTVNSGQNRRSQV